jgi:polygalacturonase
LVLRFIESLDILGLCSLDMLLLSVLSLLPSVIHASSWRTFTVPHSSPTADDSPALVAALASGNWSTNATILFKKGVHYNIHTPIKFPVLNNVEVRIEGNLSYPEDVGVVQGIVASSSFPGHWLSFSGGTNVTLRGSTDPNWGWIDGHGQAWWDVNQQVNRPHGIAFQKITNGVIRDVKIWKPVAWSFSTSGSVNLHAYNNKILANTDKPNTFPFNTDGFSAGGTNLLFENNHIENGDDCLTVGNGAKNVHFRNSYCSGGHGLSIGSLGKGGGVADVQNILIENIVMENALYAARFKSWTGGNGLARNITWKNISYKNVRFPIYVTQNYWDQGVGPKPNSTSLNNTHIADFTFQNFSGVINDDADYVEGTCVTDPCWYHVDGDTGKELVVFDLYPNTSMAYLCAYFCG